MTPPGGDNASGVSETPDYDGGVPARWPMPENVEYGYGKDGNSGGFGHSDDCKDVGQKGSTDGMSQADVARGYEGPAKYDDGQYQQDIPDKNIHDRGAGSETYAKEHSATTGKGFDGRGHDKPGRGQMGSSSVKPGNLAD
jgi:hypothetical protein